MAIASASTLLEFPATSFKVSGLHSSWGEEVHDPEWDRRSRGRVLATRPSHCKRLLPRGARHVAPVGIGSGSGDGDIRKLSRLHYSAAARASGAGAAVSAGAAPPPEAASSPGRRWR